MLFPVKWLRVCALFSVALLASVMLATLPSSPAEAESSKGGPWCYSYLETQLKRNSSGSGNTSSVTIRVRPRARCTWEKFDLWDDGAWTEVGSLCVYHGSYKGCGRIWDLKGYVNTTGRWFSARTVHSAGTYRVCATFSAIGTFYEDGYFSVWGESTAQWGHRQQCKNVYVSV